MGINHCSYDPLRHHVISMGSCTTNCLLPGGQGAARMAFRVPVQHVSVVNLTVELQRVTNADPINAALEEAAAGPLRGILA
jgi:glyceraldehyde-3-phosphate dehydrogenase/erythrose-4-phosphate dehydrogenase